MLTIASMRANKKSLFYKWGWGYVQLHLVMQQLHCRFHVRRIREQVCNGGKHRKSVLAK
jgi:hypothetical protein